MNEAGINTVGFEKFAGNSKDLRKIKEAHLRLRSEFPEEFEELTIRYGFDKDTTTFGWYNPKAQEIVYNKAVFDFHSKMEKQYAKTVQNNLSPKGTDYMATIYHEFGHRYSYFHDLNNKQIIAELLRETGKGYFSKGKADEFIYQKLSGYATKETRPVYAETIAECFAEWYNSSNPRKFCEQYLKKAGVIK